MAYESKVYRVLIASPSDVNEEREISTRIIQDWNALHSFNKKIVLLPIRWETHTSPTYGERPQEIINLQIVDDCDLVVGFFWTRIGTPTGVDMSGTIEEIKRAAKANKQIMLYFSKRGQDPSLIDLDQLSQLNSFKKEVYNNALVESYSSLVEFRDKLSRQLEIKIREIDEFVNDDQDILNFSFIDLETGKLRDKQISVDLERINVNATEIEKYLKNNIKVGERKWKFQSNVIEYVNKNNNIPVALGLENKSNKILNSVSSEFWIESEKLNQVGIHMIDSRSKVNYSYLLDEHDLSKEDAQKLKKLLSNKPVDEIFAKQEIDIAPFNIFPSKTKVLEPILLMYPKESMAINICLKVYSQNILQEYCEKVTIKINFSERQITKAEFDDVFENLPEVEDIPF